MAVATTRTVSLQGAVGHLVDVQADVSSGLIATALVGRGDQAISEARDRCKAAVLNSGLDWPTTRRTTVLLSPADLPKHGSHFDLAIAVAVVAAAAKEWSAGGLDRTVLIGELSLDGRLRCVPGVLPMSMAAAASGVDTVYVPEPQVDEALMVPGIQVFGVRSLAQAVALLTGEEVPSAPPVQPLAPADLLSWRGEDRLDDLDMAEVLGLEETRYALEVAAAGGHHLMLTGPKGVGKTTLAERLPGLLPDLDEEESLELTVIHSLSGTLPPGAPRLRRPPFRAPHHSASRTGVLGGGTGRIRPGEVSRAHLGVLFLDEFPLFRSDVVEALREPLEAGEVSISRGEENAVYPARAMFVFASNPCPCGNFTADPRTNDCSCVETARRTYRSKISGPIADRIDITCHVQPQQRGAVPLPFERPESSAAIRARVVAARDRQRLRYAGMSWRLNGQAPGALLRDRWPLTKEATLRLEETVYSGVLSRRGAVRVHRVAWSVADLRGVERPGLQELEIALRLRSGEPLPVVVVRPVADETETKPA